MTRQIRPGKGFHAIGVYHPKREVNIGSLWRSAWLYRCAFIFTVGARYHSQASDTAHSANNVPLLHYADMADLINHLPYGCPLVAVEQATTATSLWTYVHPVRAAYILGAEDSGLPASVQSYCVSTLEVETPLEVCMNLACAGTVALHDRYTKSLRRSNDT